MSDETKPQSIGGVLAGAAFLRKYGPWALAFISWLVVAVPYVLGTSKTAPPLPPVLPQAQPLVVVVGAPAHTALPADHK